MNKKKLKKNPNYVILQMPKTTNCGMTFMKSNLKSKFQMTKKVDNTLGRFPLFFEENKYDLMLECDKNLQTHRTITAPSTLAIWFCVLRACELQLFPKFNLKLLSNCHSLYLTDFFSISFSRRFMLFPHFFPCLQN